MDSSFVLNGPIVAVYACTLGVYCAFTMAGVKLEVDNELTILADGEQANCSSNATAANHSGWPEFPIRQTSGSNVTESFS